MNNKREKGCWLRYQCYKCGHRLALASTACPQCGEEFDGVVRKRMPDKCECERCVEFRTTGKTDDVESLRARLATAEDANQRNLGMVEACEQMGVEREAARAEAAHWREAHRLERECHALTQGALTVVREALADMTAKRERHAEAVEAAWREGWADCAQREWGRTQKSVADAGWRDSAAREGVVTP